jgi:uncharacterized protein (TIGR02246 family)
MNLNTQALTFVALFAVYVGGVHADEDIYNEIDAGNQAFAAAIIAGDAGSAAAGYTDDAYVLAPGAATVRGREEIRAFWQGMIESGVKNVQIGTAEVASSGDIAYAVGTLAVTGADDTTGHARYVLVFKRVSGEWRLHLDIWTPSM